MRTRIKICGITRPEDALQAAALGVDAIGLVFHAASPRAVTAEQAARIVAELSPFVCTVGLFVDMPAEAVSRVLDRVRIDLLQFHGQEPAEYCRGFGKPYIKAVRMRADTDLRVYADRYPDALALLLDSYREGSAGGSGHSFDWSWVPGGLKKPIILAGGLTPENVTAAIGQLRPYAVDVSSGVETTKGIKDVAKMAAFIRGVGRAI